LQVITSIGRYEERGTSDVAISGCTVTTSELADSVRTEKIFQVVLSDRVIGSA